MTKTERTKLMEEKDDSPAVAVAVATDVANEIKKARNDGTWTFKTLGLLGGLAMILSNSLTVLNEFFSFQLSRALLEIYLLFFGILIFCLDAPGTYTQKLRSGVRFYAKFLDYTWGRGLLYIFCGSLQAANVNLLDWIVGGFMLFVGVTAVVVSQKAAQDMKLVQFSIKSEATLKKKWRQFDADGNGVLDIKELTNFVKDAGVDMSRNEIAAFFLALDRNFDEKINYEEFLKWWKKQGEGGVAMVV